VRGSLGMGAIVTREAVGVRAGGAVRDDLHALTAMAFHEVEGASSRTCHIVSKREVALAQ